MTCKLTLLLGDLMHKRLSLRLMTAFFVIGTLCPTISAATQSEQKNTQITYQEVGDSYLNSFGVVEAQPKPSTNSQTGKKGKNKLDFTFPVLSEHEKRQRIFEIQARNEKQEASNSLINEALRVTLKDLDVYYGSGRDPKKTVMNEFECKTVFGEAELAYLFAHPFLDIKTLKNRQALIKKLVEDEMLFNELSAIMKRVKKAEAGFFSYWQTNDPVSEKIFKGLYFSRLGLSKFNENPYALETLTRLDNFWTAAKIGGDFVLLTLLNYVIAKNINKFLEVDQNGRPIDALGEPVEIKDSFKDAIISTSKWYASCLDPRAYVNEFRDIDSKLKKIARLQEKKGMPKTPEELAVMKKGAIGGLIFKDVVFAAIFAYKVSLVKGAIENAAQTKNAINYLQTRLIDVASIVDACKQLKDVIKPYTDLINGLLHFDDLEKLFNDSQTSDFAKLIELLQTSTFKDRASFFSLSGRVLAANRLMIEEKEQFAPALAALGEIDACLAAAKLYKKMRNERVGYCFVDFVETAKPMLNIKDFWNPFVDYKVAVSNSLELGEGADAAKVILTGSNTGGKSTILKAIMMSLLMSHIFGIAPARNMTVSPFAFIGSYLRVNDDTALGESKFKAEVMRAKMLCDTMNALGKDQFGFIVIDELFTGTGSEKAANAAYKVAEKLAGLENNLYILATHFPLLTELEKNNAAVIKNMKVDVLKDDAGNLIRPFKLEPGISTSNVANDILNEQITDINFDI